jgi:hypothetical protein
MGEGVYVVEYTMTMVSTGFFSQILDNLVRIFNFNMETYYYIKAINVNVSVYYH